MTAPPLSLLRGVIDADVRWAHDLTLPRNPFSTTARGLEATAGEDYSQIRFFVLNIFLLLKNMRKLNRKCSTKHAKK